MEKNPKAHPDEEHLPSPAPDTSPAGQAVQFVESKPGEKVPAGQGQQSGCPTPLYRPGLQDSQAAFLPMELDLPALQLAQASMELAPGAVLEVPGKHHRQLPWSALAYLPDWHTVQLVELRSATLPAGHARHACASHCPTRELLVPAGHGVGEEEPCGQ